MEMSNKEKVTVYFNTGMCSMAKVEGYLNEVKHYDYGDGTGGEVVVTRKRCRRPSVFMTYYNPYILVVKGWNHPEPPDAFETTYSDGCTVRTSKYMSCDPALVEDFMKAVSFKDDEVVVELGSP
jgi:hypothetical protein